MRIDWCGTWVLWMRRGSLFGGGGGVLSVKCIIIESDRWTLIKLPPRWSLIVVYL